MNKERIFSIVKGAHVSEKSSNLLELNQYVFKVAIDANKTEIAKAVEQLFDVKVGRVTTAVVKGKRKAFGRRFGKRSDWKKAYVKVAEGQAIETLAAES